MSLIFVRGPRDVQRSRLYAAEREVTAFFRDPLPTVGESQRYVDGILRDRWLQLRFPASVLAPVTVLGGRKRTATALNFLSTIAMPQWARTKFIVLHELCHMLTDRYYGENLIAAHGREFATLQLALVGQFLSETDGAELREAFRRYGVTHSVRGL